jgi:hypothetical protein
VTNIGFAPIADGAGGADGGGGADLEEWKEEELLLEMLVFVGFWSAREEKGLLLSFEGRPVPYLVLTPSMGLLLNFETGADVAVGE